MRFWARRGCPMWTSSACAASKLNCISKIVWCMHVKVARGSLPGRFEFQLLIIIFIIIMIQWQFAPMMCCPLSPKTEALSMPAPRVPRLQRADLTRRLACRRGWPPGCRSNNPGVRGVSRDVHVHPCLVRDQGSGWSTGALSSPDMSILKISESYCVAERGIDERRREGIG
jgi:hypothetical protein